MWTPTQPGVDEATRDAIKALIEANLDDLNTALTYDGLWPSGFVITSDHVRLGDVTKLAPTPEEMPLLICVHPYEEDSKIRRDTISSAYTGGTVRDIYTTISVYLHEKALLTGDVIARRERVLSRISDWLTDGLFNTAPNAGITLASSIFKAPGNYDKLVGLVYDVTKDWYAKSYGAADQLRGGRFIHAGFVG